MPDAASLLFLGLVVLIALAYAFANGMNDAANAIATVISTRVLSPFLAIAMGALLNLVGALTGTAVAKTIGKGVVAPEMITELTVVATLVAATSWVLLATRYGMPVSVSHSLVASVVGAGIATGGLEVLVPNGLNKVLLALAFSPFIGFGIGLIGMVALYWIFRRSTPHAIGGIFGRLQILSAAFMAYSHGKNDGQNAMGVIAMALAVHYGWAEFEIPLWVIIASALAMAVGTAAGGWRVIRTLGLRVTKLQPVHGFAAETAAGSVIEVGSLFGLPVSTTHVISSSIMGVGASRRLSAVRWGVTGDIVAAWVITLPFCAAVGWLISWFLHLIF